MASKTVQQKEPLDQTYIFEKSIYLKGETIYPDGLFKYMKETQEKRKERSKRRDVIKIGKIANRVEQIAPLEPDNKENEIKEEETTTEEKDKVGTSLPADFPARKTLAKSGITTVEEVATRIKEDTLKDVENLTTSKTEEIAAYLTTNYNIQ